MEETIKQPKKVLIALPPAMLREVDATAIAEHRTRSDLIREALRRYLLAFKRDQTAGSIVNQLKEQVYSI
jgi:metal-responsive CopG/Arc/MetJ family transcriptional regulator